MDGKSVVESRGRTRRREAVVDVVRDDERFFALQPEWDSCLRTMPGGDFFLSHAWLRAWRRTIGREAALRVFVLRDDDGILAAAPLCRRRGRWYGVPVREMVWLGDGTSDRTQLLVRGGDRTAAALLWRRLAAHDEGQQMARLEEVPVGSVTAEVARVETGRLGREPSSTLPWVRLSGSWEEIEARLPRKFRWELRTRPKVFAGWGVWGQGVVRGTEVAGCLAEVAELERTSAKASRGYAFFQDRKNYDFFRHLLADPTFPAEPVLFTLRVDGALIAYVLGFVHRGVLSVYNIAFRPGFEKGSPGKWLWHQAMRWAHERGLAEFDFLRGASEMKARWRPDERRNLRLMIFRPGVIPGSLHLATFHVRPALQRAAARWAGRRHGG